MAATHILFFPVVLHFFFLWPNAASASGLHPVVLLPGATCSQLEARLTDAYLPPSPQCAAAAAAAPRGARWFRLWKNSTALDDPTVAPCVADQLSVVFDRVAGDYRDTGGVETRLLDFGSTRGFLADDPADR
jgi:lysophospholipase-3